MIPAISLVVPQARFSQDHQCRSLSVYALKSGMSATSVPWMHIGSYGSNPDPGLALSLCAHTHWRLRLDLSPLWEHLLSTWRFRGCSDYKAGIRGFNQWIAQPREEGSDFSSVLKEHLLWISSDSIPRLCLWAPPCCLHSCHLPEVVQSQLGAHWDTEAAVEGPSLPCACAQEQWAFRGGTTPTLSTPKVRLLFSDPALHSSDPWQRRFTSRGRPRFLPYTPAGGRHTTLQALRNACSQPSSSPGSILHSLGALAPLASGDARRRLGSAGRWHRPSAQVWFACGKLIGALSADSSKLSFCPSQWRDFTGCRNLPSYSSLPPCMQAIAFLPPFLFYFFMPPS